MISCSSVAASSVSLRAMRQSWVKTTSPLAPVSSGTHRVSWAKWFFQRTDAGEVFCPQGGGAEQLRCGRDARIASLKRVVAGRFVQQQRDGLGLAGLGLGVDFDGLVSDAEVRFLDHDAIHFHPATGDELLGFAAGAGAQFGDAFGKADGVGHGGY